MWAPIPKVERVSGQEKAKAPSHTLGDAALQTGVEGVAAEEGQEIRMPLEGGIVSIEVAESLKSGAASHRIARASPSTASGQPLRSIASALLDLWAAPSYSK